MEQNNFPPGGLFRKERQFLSDYRERAHCIGKYQLYASLMYLLIAMLVKELMLIMFSSSDRKFTYLVESKTQSFGKVDVNVHNPGFDWASSKVAFWINLNAIRAILHIKSSVLIMWATYESTPKLRAIRLCNWTRRMNLTSFLYEIVVFLFIFQEWESAFYFILYRFWFNHEVRGLLDTVQTLAPRPPGHHYQFCGFTIYWPA